jgi:hypothetical protein
MNRYMIISRLRWPALLLLTGVIALLDEMHLLSWGRAWPLYLILFGVLALAERAALASQPVPPPIDPYAAGYPAAAYPNQGYPNPGYQNPGYAGYPPQAPPSAPPTPPAPTSIVPTHTDLEVQPREPRKSWEEEER